MNEKLSDGVRRAMQLAQPEASRVGRLVVEPVDLLSGLLQVETRQRCFASVILRHLLTDITPLLTAARSACAAFDPAGHPLNCYEGCWVGPLAKSERWRAVIADASQEALSAQSEWVGTHHLLLALAGSKGGQAAAVLAEFGLHRTCLAGKLCLFGKVTWPAGDAEVVPE
jgi:ATP-dependent Clp protease ATP-binding subunit ClpA